jgi:CubicO group peptidase (beta-lactamase class C family)
MPHHPSSRPPRLLSRRDGARLSVGFLLAGVVPVRAFAAAAPTVEKQAAPGAARLASVVEQAQALPRLRTLLIAQDGQPVVERVFRGPGLDRPVNVKSVAKTILSALVGVAIDRGVLTGVDQRVTPILRDKLPPDPDPRLGEVTVGHLLAMRAGLERTSGPYYGRWVTSPDWVRFALARPFVDEPGGRMLYSTGSSHLLSAVLTRASGRSTLALARDWLGEPLGITIPPWPQDPQGIYFGGNDMLLSPRALLRFGELYRNGGLHDGQRLLPENWVRASFEPRVTSPSPATPTATAGSSPTPAATPSATPGATAGRCLRRPEPGAHRRHDLRPDGTLGPRRLRPRAARAARGGDHPGR